MTGTELATHGTVRMPQENAVWRSVRIRCPIGEVQEAWTASALPGSPEFKEAPGDRGIDVSVELFKDTNPDAEHLLSPYEGGSLGEKLESALRAFKARLETGEVATTEGQPSGRAEE